MAPQTTKKRKRACADGSPSIDPRTAEIVQLIAAASRSLALPCFPAPVQLQELLMAPGPQSKTTKKNAGMLQLKAEARLQPGLYSSDVAIRLFYKYVKQPKTSSSSVHGETTDLRCASTEALSVALIDAMSQELGTTAKQYRHILKVSQPDAAAIGSHGLHRDRILFHTREFAQLVDGNEEQLVNDPDLVFLYRDDAIAVVDKAANILSVDGNSPSEISIQRRIQKVCPDARMVHRLDYETSGILVVAMTRTAAQHLNAQFRSRTVQKTYFARVFGHVEGDEGTIELAMGPHPTEKLVQIVHPHGAHDATSSLWTKTEWNVVERTHESASREGREQDQTASFGSTLMRLKPVSGKTHQLRVHMQHLGHPILGDSLYSPELVQQKAPRLCLHAAKIEFVHPVRNEKLTIQSPCPF